MVLYNKRTEIETKQKQLTQLNGEEMMRHHVHHIQQNQNVVEMIYVHGTRLEMVTVVCYFSIFYVCTCFEMFITIYTNIQDAHRVPFWK